MFRRGSQIGRHFQAGNGGGSFQEWSPTLLPGCILYLRADRGITIATGVSQWNDLSTAGNNATQGTGGIQPTFEAAGFNGKPSVLFNGSSFFLSANGVATSETGSNIPITCIAAVQSTANVAADAISFTSSASDNAFYAMHGDSGTAWRTRRRDDAASAVVATNGTSDLNRHIVTTIFNGTTENQFVDGAARAGDPTAMSVGALTLNRFSVGCLNLSSGAAAFWAGRVAAVAMYSRAITTAERHAAEHWMGNLVGVTVV